MKKVYDRTVNTQRSGLINFCCQFSSRQHLQLFIFFQYFHKIASKYSAVCIWSVLSRGETKIHHCRNGYKIQSENRRHRCKTDTPTHIHDSSFSWFGTNTSVNSDEVTLILFAQTPLLVTWWDHASIMNMRIKWPTHIHLGE